MDKESKINGEAENIYKENIDEISTNNSTINNHMDTSSSYGNTEKINTPYFGNGTISDVSNISSFSNDVKKNDTHLLIISYSIILAILSLFLVCAFFYVSKKKLYEKEKDRYIKEKSSTSSCRSLTRSEYYDSLSHSYSNTALFSSRSNSNRPSTTNLSSLSRESNYTINITNNDININTINNYNHINNYNYIKNYNNINNYNNGINNYYYNYNKSNKISNKINNNNIINQNIINSSVNDYPQLNKYSSSIEKINNETLTPFSLSRYPNSLKYSKINYHQYPIKNEYNYYNTYKSNETDKSILIPKAVITTNGKFLLSNKEDYNTL